MNTFDENKHGRDRAGRFAPHAGDPQEGGLGDDADRLTEGRRLGDDETAAPPTPERISMTSMQTTEPLKRLSMQVENRALSWIIQGAGQGSDDAFDMDQPYQRGHVWSVARKQKLIRSLLEGVPVPSLIVNDRFGAGFAHPGYGQDRLWATAVIDGKQRISAIAGFANGEFAIPASWPEDGWVVKTEDTDDGPYVRWAGLSAPARLFFSKLAIGVNTGKFRTLADEEEIFTRVNFGGVAQGDTDLPGER